MSDRLFIRLAPDGNLSWLRPGNGLNPVLVQGAPPAEVLVRVRETVVLVPAEDVLLIETHVVARNQAQLLKALPYAVEDQLLSPVEEQHFTAVQDQGENIGVAVVAKEKLCNWLAWLEAAHIRADVLLPETAALPLTSQTSTVLIEDIRAFVRLDDNIAFACSTEELPEWLAQIPKMHVRPVEVFDYREEAAQLILPVPLSIYHQCQGDALALLARGVEITPRLNLLSGEFAPYHRQIRAKRLWRVAALCAVVTVIIAFIALSIEVLTLTHTSAELDARLQDKVRNAFPEIGPVELARVNPETLIKTRLERLRGGVESSALLRVLTAIAPILGSTTHIQTRGLEYRNGVLELALRTPDVATLDILRERFATLPGLKVEVTGANPGSVGVDGRIRIQGVPP